ncbi:PilW family protein [Motiliproteus sp. SC1-56]|uniref:PilW family protein n=1 Tax=Motiliproteus sp. SC1-56 TaxID=2799565 RepID=UPI001A9021CA|nr:PilW family protein [Motiliproteus sp. SC1-56]
MRRGQPLYRLRQAGLSLVELMIALVISTFLMLGVFEIFVGSSGTDRMAHAFARVQETGRLAMDILSRDLRMAGYQGCIDPVLVDMNIIADGAPTYDLTNDGIRGYETDHSHWDVANRNDDLDFISGVPEGSDVVYLQFVSPTGVNVLCQGNINSCTAVNANVKIDNNSIGLNQYDIVVVSDCESADMFRIVNFQKDSDGKNTLAHSESNNSSNNLSKPYGEDAQVMTYKALAYYVRDTGRNNSQGDDIYALYQFDATFHDGSGNVTGKEEELVEGVESLQVTYGQRVNKNLRFVPADDGNLDFASVEAIRLAVLVSSSEPVLKEDDSRSYQLPGALVEPAGATTPEATHPGDRRLRQVFTSTLYLRNLDR